MVGVVMGHHPNDAAYKAAKRDANELKAKQHMEYTKGLAFLGFGKIPRLNREIIITEKIDGTNGAIGILEFEYLDEESGDPMVGHHVYAQSRSRIISPYDDNSGFAAWVEQHAERLIVTLGAGLHYGEWWGKGINRGYGLDERRFSLFNTEKWNEGEGDLALANARLNGCPIYCVPILYRGPWFKQDMPGSTPLYAPNCILSSLRAHGSYSAPGCMNPEGIVVYHKASGQLFKTTLEDDEKPKASREIGGGVMGKVQNDYMQAWHNIRWVFQPGKGYRYWHKDQAQLDQWNKEYDGWRRSNGKSTK
jgi:hypothetical protein